MDLQRRKYDLREKLLGDKELMNVQREAHLAEQLELLKLDRDNILLKLDEIGPDSNNASFVNLTETGMQKKLDEIETRITGGYKVLLDDPGDLSFKNSKTSKDFNQAHIVKVKDLETQQKLLVGREKQI